MRKTGHFTHVRGNLRGDVSGKRFSTHVGEGNLARIGDGRCGNDKGMVSASGVRCAMEQGKLTQVITAAGKARSVDNLGRRDHCREAM